MSKVSIARKSSALDGHDVILALSKARAAATLAEICSFDTDYLQMPKVVADEDDIRAWIESFAFDALDQALAKAETAFRKEKGAGR